MLSYGYDKIFYMEKRKPHYDLKKFKGLFRKRNTRMITQTARKNAVEIGYASEEEILEVIKNLCNDSFYKSMTTHNNPKLWQDVYKYYDKEKNIRVYIKIQISNNYAVLIQMKKDEEG